jgi:PAS domain S-box-containing protein
MKNKREQLDAVDPSTDSTSSSQVNSRLRQGSGGQAGQDLRRQAEAKLTERKKKAAALPATESDTQRLFHELEVHQIELEMQNEELVQSRAQVEAGLRQYTDLYDLAPIGYFTLACDGTIRQVNLSGASLLGVERGALINRRLGVFISTQSRTTFNTFVEKVFGSQQKEVCEVALQKVGSVPLWVHIEAIREDGQREACHAVVSDITERKRVEEVLQEDAKEREKLNKELQSALDNVKTLQGLIPMCANCKKIRDDKGFWNQVEGYIMKHTDATFTHGVCPDCAEKLYGDLYEKALEKQKKKNM